MNKVSFAGKTMSFFCPNCNNKNIRSDDFSGGNICVCCFCKTSLLIHRSESDIIVKPIKDYRLSESAGRSALKDVVLENPTVVWARFSHRAGEKIAYILTNHRSVDHLIDIFPAKTHIECFGLRQDEWQNIKQTRLNKDVLDFCWNYADRHGDVAIAVDENEVGIYEICITESHVSFIKDHLNKPCLLIPSEPKYRERCEFHFFKGYEDITERVGGYY